MIEGETFGAFVEEPGTESPPTRWYWWVAVLAFIVGGFAFKFWIYTASPDWLVRVLGFIGL